MISLNQFSVFDNIYEVKHSLNGHYFEEIRTYVKMHVNVTLINKNYDCIIAHLEGLFSALIELHVRKGVTKLMFVFRVIYLSRSPLRSMFMSPHT